MSSFAKAAVLLIVPPQQVHVVHLILILLDHVHQMFLQVRRIHLDNRGQFSILLQYYYRYFNWHLWTWTHIHEMKSSSVQFTLPLAACRSGQPESASCTWRCGRARLETSGPDRASAQTTSEQQYIYTQCRCCFSKKRSTFLLT